MSNRGNDLLLKLLHYRSVSTQFTSIAYQRRIIDRGSVSGGVSAAERLDEADLISRALINAAVFHK